MTTKNCKACGQEFVTKWKFGVHSSVTVDSIICRKCYPMWAKFVHEHIQSKENLWNIFIEKINKIQDKERVEFT